jgi:c-di-GMP-binding flagellar brake protein YcgR
MEDQDAVRPDRRRHPRYEILAQVRFRRAATIHVLDVANISTSGLFVRASTEAMLRKVTVGERLEIDLSTEHDLQNIRIVARVVRIVGEGGAANWGFGLEFAELGAPAREALDRLVAEAAADSLKPPPLPTESEPFVVLPLADKKNDGPPNGR